MTGRYATLQRLKEVIRKSYAGAKADDTLIFYFSGHGSPGGCAAFDSRMSNGSNGLLSFDYIASVMKKSPARRKLIIADACYSGTSRKRNQSRREHRKSDPNVILFMSSRANETSLETRGADNSVFTHYLLKGMEGEADANRDRNISAKELFKYVSRQVIDSTGGMQHPVMWGNFDENFVIFKH